MLVFFSDTHLGVQIGLMIFDKIYFVKGDFMPHCTNCNYKRKAKEVMIHGFSKNGKDYPICGKKAIHFS